MPCRSRSGRNTVYRIPGVEDLRLDADLPPVGSDIWRAISADMGASPEDYSQVGRSCACTGTVVVAFDPDRSAKIVRERVSAINRGINWESLPSAEIVAARLWITAAEQARIIRPGVIESYEARPFGPARKLIHPQQHPTTSSRFRIFFCTSQPRRMLKILPIGAKIRRILGTVTFPSFKSHGLALRPNREMRLRLDAQLPLT
ncbi:hypothetical protein BC832DRAFT_565302 [Gaertneriomyces semiglobifer]|nr:hypothetical protein BC832DRAFT_565302 [Gaertneriomyces semiglobifer]